jgi:CDP-diglyceride synthetase
MYTPLGRVLDWNFLGFDNPLTGPNPQFPVEAHVMFGWLFLIWYGLLAWAFVYFRKHTSTAFSFFLVSSVMGALLIDSQYAASELFTALLGLGLLFIVGFLRRLLILATLHSRYAMQWMQGVNE